MTSTTGMAGGLVVGCRRNVSVTDGQAAQGRSAQVTRLNTNLERAEVGP